MTKYNIDIVSDTVCPVNEPPSLTKKKVIISLKANKNWIHI